jgi:hypothetical protein
MSKDYGTTHRWVYYTIENNSLKLTMSDTRSLIPTERIERSILLIRGQKVLLDTDLASLYGVETKRLVEATKRNIERFPEDFMFQLSWEEAGILRSHVATPSSQASESLRSQIATLKRGKHLKYRPYAFTEQGVAMLSSVLRSPRAVAVNVEIMRAFVRLQQMLLSHADLARKVDNLEKKYDSQFKVVFDALRQLMQPLEEKPKRPIGFHAKP